MIMNEDRSFPVQERPRRTGCRWAMYAQRTPVQLGAAGLRKMASPRSRVRALGGWRIIFLGNLKTPKVS